MTEQQQSRSEQLSELGRIGMTSLIREPVREAVREALAEERIAADGSTSTHRTDNEGQTDSGNRFLRPGILLPILGLAAAGAIVGRRLMKSANGMGVTDQSDEMASPHDSGQRTTAGSTPTGVGDSTTDGDGEDTDSSE